MQLSDLSLKACSAPLFVQPRTTCQGWDCPQQDGLSHVNHQSRKCPHRLAYRSLWFSPLLEWHSIFNYSLCQVDKNQLAQRVRTEGVPTNGWKLPIEKQWLPKSFQPLFGQLYLCLQTAVFAFWDQVLWSILCWPWSSLSIQSNSWYSHLNLPTAGIQACTTILSYSSTFGVSFFTYLLISGAS